MSSTNPSAQGLDRNMGHRAPVVFSAAELARVTGLPVRQIRALIYTATIPTIDGALVAHHDALRACRALIDGRLAAPVGGTGSGLLSRDRADSTRDGRSTSVSVRAARSASAAEFDRRYIPAADVAPRSNTAGILPRRVLSRPGAASITTGLGATPHLHYGLLVSASVHAAVLALILVIAPVAVPRARPDDARNITARAGPAGVRRGPRPRWRRTPPAHTAATRGRRGCPAPQQSAATASTAEAPTTAPQTGAAIAETARPRPAAAAVGAGHDPTGARDREPRRRHGRRRRTQIRRGRGTGHRTWCRTG